MVTHAPPCGGLVNIAHGEQGQTSNFPVTGIPLIYFVSIVAVFHIVAKLIIQYANF